MPDLGASAALAAPAVGAAEEPPAPGMEGAEPLPPGRAAHLVLPLSLHGCSAERLERLPSEACGTWMERQSCSHQVGQLWLLCCVDALLQDHHCC